MKQKSKYIFFEYFLLTAIIALTGFEFFFRDNIILYFIVGPISIILFLNGKKQVAPRLILFLVILFILYLMQSLKFKMPYSFAFAGIIRFLIYYLLASVIGTRFNKVFVNILYIICLYSIVLYFLTLISPSFYDFLIKISKSITSINIDEEYISKTANPSQNIVLYVIPLINKLQNCGPFWEPGMFAVFINIALAINILETKKINEIKNIVFLIASITTFSAASFIATFVIFCYHFIFVKKNINSIIFILIVPFVVVPVYNSKYISGKILSNYQTIDESYSRFGAIFVHFKQIEKSPIIGYGAFVNESVERLLGEIQVSPNGLTNIIRVFGIPMSLLFYFLLFKSAQFISKSKFNKVNNRDATLLFLVLLIVAFSQDVTTRHFYYLLYTLSFIKTINIRKKNNINRLSKIHKSI